ncbi:MAG: hypothetical protein ACRD3W_25010 [Terriglobales bacterium]
MDSNGAEEMRVDVYSSRKSSSKFVSVLHGTNLAGVQSPADPDLHISNLSLFKTIDIQAEEKRAGFDAADVINQIEEKGFAIHGSKFIVNEG